VLFTLLFAQAKNKPSARTGPGILCRSRHTDQKGKVLRSCTKRATTPDGTGHLLPLVSGTPLKKVRCCTAAQKSGS